MRSVACLFALGCSLAACGDNNGNAPPDVAPSPSDGPSIDAPPGATCAPTPPELPATGAHIDPYEIALQGCVDGGLRDLPGRWFARSPTEKFVFEYPKFEGDCDTGFRRANVDEDHDPEDGYTFHTWSDGTRFFSREQYVFDFGGGDVFTFTSVFAACMRDADTLIAGGLQAFSDEPASVFELTGERYEPKDGPGGLMLVSELGVQNNRPIVGYNVVVRNRYAYVVGTFGLHIIDITVPEDPRPTGQLPGLFNDVRVFNRGGKTVAYLAPLQPGRPTLVVDVTDPANPVLVASLPEFSHSVFVTTTGPTPYLWLSTYTDVVPRYDLTNPLAPARVDQATLTGASDGVHDLYVAGDKLYVNYTTAGVVALDISGGLATATELARTPSTYSHNAWAGIAGERAVVLHGDEGMTPEGGAHLKVLDGDPTSATYLKELGRYQTREEVGIHNFEAVGDKAYIAYYHDGVRVVDLSTPTAPVEVAHYNTLDLDTAYGQAFEGAMGIRVVGGLIYVADSNRGLMIFREE